MQEVSIRLRFIRECLGSAKRRKGAIAGLDQAMSRYAVTGTFNVSNLLALQSTSGTAAEKTAKNTEKMVEEQKKTNEKIDGMRTKYT